MWQPPGYRVKAYVESLRKNAQARKRAAAQPGQRICRVKTDLAILDALGTPTKVIEARLLLNEFKVEGISVFSAEPIKPGTPVAITIQEPTIFYIAGTIGSSKLLLTKTSVFSNQSFPYLLQITFDINSDSEREIIRQFSETLIPLYLEKSRAA